MICPAFGIRSNAIAKGYRDYYIQTQKERVEKGLKVLTEQFQAEEARIHEVQSNLDLLHQKLGIQNQNDTPDNHLPEQQPYWDEKQKLDQMLDRHKVLAAKIEAVKLDLSVPQTMVEIVDQAEPPQFPVGPNRFLGGALCFIGLFPLTGGTLFIKSSRRQIV